jgi:hypothetical protein
MPPIVRRAVADLIAVIVCVLMMGGMATLLLWAVYMR